jgi:hypothetical protein
MRELPCLILILVTLAAMPRGSASWENEAAGAVPIYHAADAAAPSVTEHNLLESERFWPYHVALIRPWRPAARAKPLPAGVSGVLIRVEASGPATRHRPPGLWGALSGLVALGRSPAPLLARIDFGREGLHTVPIAETDLLGNANRVRSGGLPKFGPNFVVALGPRLVDASYAAPRALGVREAMRYRGFLAVFADPTADGFAELATALAPRRERSGVLTVLLPQGEHPDAEIHRRLRSLDWTICFVFDYLSAPYTRSLLPESSRLPFLMLQTGEGRVLFQGVWEPEVASDLLRALDDAFGIAASAGAPSEGDRGAGGPALYWRRGAHRGGSLVQP